MVNGTIHGETPPISMASMFTRACTVNYGPICPNNALSFQITPLKITSESQSRPTCPDKFTKVILLKDLKGKDSGNMLNLIAWQGMSIFSKKSQSFK